MVVVSVFFLCLHLYLQPFADDGDEKLQSVALVCTSFMAYGALLLKQAVQEPWLRAVIFGVFVIPVLGFLFIFLYVLIKGASGWPHC